MDLRRVARPRLDWKPLSLPSNSDTQRLERDRHVVALGVPSSPSPRPQSSAGGSVPAATSMSVCTPRPFHTFPVSPGGRLFGADQWVGAVLSNRGSQPAPGPPPAPALGSKAATLAIAARPWAPPWAPRPPGSLMRQQPCLPLAWSRRKPPQRARRATFSSTRIRVARLDLVWTRL